MTTVHEYRREVRDYLRAGYAITDIEELHGKHTKFKFVYNGRTVLLPLNDQNGAGGSSAPDMKLQDIRRMLGPPPHDPDAAPDRPRRTLDEMTAEAAAAAPPPAAGVPSEEYASESAPQPRGTPTTVALYESNSLLTFLLPDALVADFYRGARTRGVRCDFTAPDLWTLRHTEAERPAPVEAHAGWYRLKIGGIFTYHRIGAFKATPAEVWLEGGCLRVRLTEAPRRYGEPVKVISPAEKAFTKAIDNLDKKHVPKPAEALVAVAHVEGEENATYIDGLSILDAPSHTHPPEYVVETPVPPAAVDLRDEPFDASQAHLRSLLEQVRALEAGTPWRLERDAETGALRWRAVMVVE